MFIKVIHTRKINSKWSPKSQNPMRISRSEAAKLHRPCVRRTSAQKYDASNRSRQGRSLPKSGFLKKCSFFDGFAARFCRFFGRFLCVTMSHYATDSSGSLFLPNYHYNLQNMNKCYYVQVHIYTFLHTSQHFASTQVFYFENILLLLNYARLK